MVGLLDPLKYGENFYELYTNNTRRKLLNDRKILAKRKSKDKKAAALAAAAAVLEGNAGAIVNPIDPPIAKDQLLQFPIFPQAHIELEANASKFAVFSAIRSTVLEAETRYALFQDNGVDGSVTKCLTNLNTTCCLVCIGTCKVNNLLDCSCHSVLSAMAAVAGGEKRVTRDSTNSDADSESDEGTDKDNTSPLTFLRVPFIVGAGLRSLFDLIADARHMQPVLCTKALKALLDVIQGQQPESFKHEPDDLIDPLYDLLLDLATMSTLSVGAIGNNINTVESNWSAMACAALIGLCIARGDTGKILKAISAMLMSPKQLSSQMIQLPVVLVALQRTVISAALNKPTRPDFYSQGVPMNSRVDEFTLKNSIMLSLPLNAQPAMASDGTYIYLLLGSALLKIGTGFGGSYKGHVYAQNEEFTKEKAGWLGYCGGQLYFRRFSKRSTEHLHLVSTDTLAIKGINPLNMSMREGCNYVLFTDEDSLNAICTNRDDTLVVKRLSMYHANYINDSTPNELPLQLARRKFRTLGYATFEDEVLNQNQIQKIQVSYNIFEPKLPNDADVQSIVCGKEFGIVRAANGKVYYYGKSASLGLKSIGRTPTLKMTELIVSKVSNIVHVALGHDGIHALLVNDDGTVYFTGTARRGEDGDSSKNRRQPKAVKPKKMVKIDGHIIVQAACNNGTSAFVTKTGKLIMFGKDTAHCDSMGYVSDFIDQFITKVALGKAHCVALNSKGELYTFGLNNKGQCGRVFTKTRNSHAPFSAFSYVVNPLTGNLNDGTSDNMSIANDSKDGGNYMDKRMNLDVANLCDSDEHQLVQGQCRVCVVCRECTGYQLSCVSSLGVPFESRVPGAICACGHGDSGCKKCGLCTPCVRLQEMETDVKGSKQLQMELNRQRSKSLMMRRKEKKSLQEDQNASAETEKDPPRVAPLAPQMLSLPSSSPVVQVACGLHHTVALTLAGEVFTFGSNQYGQLGTGDLQPINGPVKVHVQGAVSQVSAGSNHTVLMTFKGLVYTFGSYQKGQLGRLPNDYQQHQKLVDAQEDQGSSSGAKIQQDSHDTGGDITYTPFAKDNTVTSLWSQRQKYLWHCSPGVVTGLGSNYGKRATWIGASGDQTFIKIDELLITPHMLPKMNVVANRKTMILLPSIPLSFNALSINRRDGTCTAHYHNQMNFVQLLQAQKENIMPEVNQNVTSTSGVAAEGGASGSCFANKRSPCSSVCPINEQMSRSMHEARNQIFDMQEQNDSDQHRQRNRLEQQTSKATSSSISFTASGSADKLQPQMAFALDPLYDVLWMYDGVARNFQCFNVLASEIPENGPNSANYKAILSPELCLPKKSDTRISRSQAALNLLACLDVLTSAQDSIPGCFEEPTPKRQQQMKEAQSNDYQIVNRFDNFGGGWGYSGHSVEAIRFSADTDVMLCGFGMFGGRGEYTCKLKVFDLGSDGGGYEKEGTMISETKEVPFECAARSKYHIMLPKAISAVAGRWYLVWTRIAGPSSDCGSCGQASVTTEDQVVFTFKSSKKANNGTDVNSGQIPAILYRLITQEAKQPPPLIDVDPVQRISKAFANSVTKECFESLVMLLNWSWEMFKSNLREQRDKTRHLQVKQALEYLSHVNKSCLRLLRKYANEIYPKRTEASRAMFNVSNNPIVSSSLAATLSKLQNKSSGKICEAKDKNSKSLSNSATATVIASNVAKYLADATVSSSTLNSSINGSGAIVTTTTARKPNMENIQLAECIGNVRALLIGILCDEIFKDISSEEGHTMFLEIIAECHTSFVSCFDAFYPTSSLKWNCLCDLLSKMDKGTLHSRLLSAILAGLCSPSVKLRSTFSLLNSGDERQSIISPSDNSGLPMLSSTEAHQYPILVEQMIYRTQQEKSDFLSNSWTFKDVLVRLLDIVANPIRVKIELIYHRSPHFNCNICYPSKDLNQGLIDNCCHLLARVLAEIVYQTSLGDYDKMFLPPRSLHSTSSRFSRCDVSRTWNTGNFGPDAIAFSVDRPGIAIAGAMIYSGSGSYDYQLELLYDNTVDAQSQHKWETLESISGAYGQDAVHNDMAEIKFERPVHIKENSRYALRLCSQGARTCSGDAGLSSLRGPCGTTFHFYACDLSFNGTTPQRGQIPCILYYSTPIKTECVVSNANTRVDTSAFNGSFSAEVTMRETALQIVSDITKKCSDLLILARNALAASLSPSDNSSNHTQTIDSEHNITPIEEHMDINWANNSRTSSGVLPADANMSTARDITRRIESFSKGIMETLKFDKRSSTNPFEMEIEIGSTEIHPKDLMIEESAGLQDFNIRNGEMAKFNGNERTEDEIAEDFVNAHHLHHNHAHVFMTKSETDDVTPAQLTIVQMLDVFNMASANLFHTLLPLVYAHIASLARSDPKSSVQILNLVKDILPHIAALNQLYISKDQKSAAISVNSVNAGIPRPRIAVNTFENRGVVERKHFEAVDSSDKTGPISTNNYTTSNHYCVVESDHPYRSACINCYRVEFPACVQWLTIEFDSQCGTAQLEDYLLLSIPMRPSVVESCHNDDYYDMLDNNIPWAGRTGICKNATLLTSCYKTGNNITKDTTFSDRFHADSKPSDNNWIVVKKFNTASNWMQHVMILPGNCVEFSLETSSLYAQDPHINRYGFKCLVVGYDNPITLNTRNSCLIRLEEELAYLGGMCSANLMKKELNLPDDNDFDDLNGVEETISAHHTLLSKGFALSEPVLTVQQALESYLPIGSQSNERQFLKDFISCAPGSSGARLASWLQPESRLDPNKCELNTINEPLRYGWPTQITISIRDQYGDAVLVPELKVEIKAIPTGSTGNGNIKMRRTSYMDNNSGFGDMAAPPRLNYEPTIKEKMCFKAITFMKSYNNYSFEELRFSSPVQTRVTETLYAQDMEDGTFSVHWTPSSVGSYCLTVNIDGIILEEVYRVEVKQGGLPPPSQKCSIKKPQPPNKLRKFYTKNTAGLRIRSHPTLQSEQVGIIKLNGIISFIDEIENDDGVWLRLSTESIRQHCTIGWYPTEAWCLQYNQHLGKTLLHPVVENANDVSETANITDNCSSSGCDIDGNGDNGGDGGGDADSGRTDDSGGNDGEMSANSINVSNCTVGYNVSNRSVSKARHKSFLENIDPLVSPLTTKDTPSKPKSASPSKKIHDLAPNSARFTPLPKFLNSQSSSTNPFLFSDKTESEELRRDANDDVQRSVSASTCLSETSCETQMYTQLQQEPQSIESASELLTSSTLHGPSSSNLGSAIAGVVGGGASKLQALQKWFKGDSPEGFIVGSLGSISVKEHQSKRSDVSELASVSVRELVKAMGGHDVATRGTNGNSSNSMQIFSTVDNTSKLMAATNADSGNSKKLTEMSSKNFSSNTPDGSQAFLKISNTETVAKFDVSSIRQTNFTPSQTAALLSTPKHSSRKLTGSQREKAALTGEVGISKVVKESDLSNLEEEMSLLQITTTTSIKGDAIQDEIIFGGDGIGTTNIADSIENSSLPVWPAALNSIDSLSQNPLATSTEIPTTSNIRTTIGPIKRAMPPSLAESIRAVFAAFLWHEGIVHDAMACASFLKFHPSLPKEGATVVTRREHTDAKVQLSREQKAQQRHSVEVANAGTYLNIRPSTLETLTKSGNSSINNRKYRKNQLNDKSEIAGGEKQKLHALPEVITVLPPALRCLVYLWEQVCAHCIQVVQSNTFVRVKNSSPTQGANVETREKREVNEKEIKRSRKKKKDDGSWCEICEMFLPIPVTYHMRIVHPGCGKSARGKGYNSVGIFCEGWAGNCGEGGKGASSWFLMCDACRQKYITTNKTSTSVNATACVNNTSNENILFGVKTTSLIANSEVYTNMRENATFLLELSSSVSNLPTGPSGSYTMSGGTGGGLLSTTTKRSPQQMPIVVEHQHLNIVDMNKPSTSRGDSVRNSRIGLRMSSKFGNFTPFRKSFVAGIAPDHGWLPPETFACLETLGATNNDDLPYEIFGLNAVENGFDRPLSEISYESFDPNYEMMTTSVATQDPGNPVANSLLSKFHRSFSMGQGWAAAQQQQGGYNYRVFPSNHDENQQPKVVYRRRNNSTSEGDGSLLICYPSENLRKLVPEQLLATAIVHPALHRVAATEICGNKDFGHVSKCTNVNDQQQPKSVGVVPPEINAHEYSGKSKLEVDPVVSPADEGSIVQLKALLGRPSMSFMTQKHDLNKLRYVMKRSLRIAMCRIYSLQALNWLLRSVTQNVCLHDLMWWFVSSLSVSSEELVDGKYEDAEPALEHPMAFTQINGGFSHMITQSLHVLLQSVADLTLYLPLGSPLQRIAIQCFGIRFHQTDHQFLHSSHVFGNISKILSKSDEQDDAMTASTAVVGTTEAVSMDHDIEHNIQLGGSSGGVTVGYTLGVANSCSGNAGAKIIYYTDLAGMFEITVSSRQAMAESLIDNSTETFWESDEEDRNKCKIIEISMNKFNYNCKLVLVHIDNSRDVQNKVLNVVFYAGQSLGDTNLIKSVDVDQKACAWISARINDENYTHFRLEFHGSESTLRVRQIKLLGLPSIMSGPEEQWGDLTAQSLRSNLKLTYATRIQQQICEAETLRVFRLITSQVFGKLIMTTKSGQEYSRQGDSHHQSVLGMDSSEGNSILVDSLDLREHMVGILFSRSKLSHLQKQVIVHIVHAIKKEAQRAKEDWDLVNLTNCYKGTQGTTTSATSTGDPKSDSSSERYRAPDTYCFEMLSMVLALSGSVVGRSYLSHQHGLLKDLLSLLHTGSDRVQRQVTALLRRILPEMAPENFADLLGVQKLPPTDYNIVHHSSYDFDMNRLGLLDIFLAVIAKSLQLQVKVKTTIAKLHLEKTPSFIRLCNSLDLSIHLLKSKSKAAEKSTIPIEVESTLNRTTHPSCFETNVNNQEVVQVLGFDVGRSTLKSSQKESKKNINQRWFLNGVISTKQAESIIALIRDLASGKLNEKWSQITKAGIAESVLNLTRLDEVFRTPENCIKTATLWLALASLCVLDRDHVEKLSSGQWSKVSDTRPMCSNHDDGETAAIIQCETCGSLCGDCDRFLHLNRKTRMHKRTVCKEEEEAIRVELHESCGRTKLFWLLALADSKTLKAMVEFRDGSHTIISGPQESVGRCRFCGIIGNSGLLEIGNVCADAQCQEYAANSCLKTKGCGHVCGGVTNEKKCLPCLQHTCHARENEMARELQEPKLTQDADDMCMICFVEALSCAPSIQLECGHVFHYHCCQAVLEKRWSGPRITFGFSLCPICKADIQHVLLSEILQPINALKQDVKRKALMRLKYEGVVKDLDNKDLINMAMDRYAYYVCFKCQKAYYGGEARCDAEIGEKFDPEELVCGGCSDVARAQMCPKHGTDFLEYKCRYCCSVAVFFCFGTTHFCDTCHDDFQRLTNVPKNKLPQCPAGPKAKQLLGDECPLHIMHPPTGEEFALGCGVCRNAQTF